MEYLIDAKELASKVILEKKEYYRLVNDAESGDRVAKSALAERQGLFDQIYTLEDEIKKLKGIV